MRLRPALVVLVGFVIGWAAPSDARQAPTFTKDIAPIFFKNCSQCHRPNDVAPMPLMTYEQARPWARSIKSKVLKREMPPWGVGQSTLKFSNDRQMSDHEIKTIVSWVDGGAPMGNAADMPAAPEYPGGWKFNSAPDVVLRMPVEFTIEPKSEYPMLDFYVPIPWTDGMKLIQMSEARPSNKAVVHHITVSLVTFPPGTEVIDGQPFTTDATGKKVPLDRRTARITEQKLPGDMQIPREPGEKPDRLSSVGGFTTLLAYVAGRGFDDHPDGVGTPALPGQYINFNMHYTPTGRPEVDRSELGLWFAKEPLKKFHFRTPINERQHVNGKLVRGPVPDAADVEAGRVSQGATATTISSFSGLPPIPPYVSDYTVTSELAITQDITINGFYPHMHVRGKSATYSAVYPDGREQLLFDVPNYRFDWQERYVLAAPLKVPKGTMLKYRAVFDNSANNPLNPNPDKEVYWSEQSWDEMSLGWIEYTLDKQRLPARTESRQK
jgi:mono/diheme cytochrome c family protein